MGQQYFNGCFSFNHNKLLVQPRIQTVGMAFMKDANYPFDAHCCHMGTAIEHPVPDQVKPSFVIFDSRAL